jgi:hypothetical protein
MAMENAKMETQIETRSKAAPRSAGPDLSNGAAWAAFLAAAIGAFAVGFFVILNEAGLYSAPALYGPAGGVSGRTTFAIVIWLAAWALLHARWSGREIGVRPVLSATVVLVALGILGTFPPVWSMF